MAVTVGGQQQQPPPPSLVVKKEPPADSRLGLLGNRWQQKMIALWSIWSPITTKVTCVAVFSSLISVFSFSSLSVPLSFMEAT